MSLFSGFFSVFLINSVFIFFFIFFIFYTLTETVSPVSHFCCFLIPPVDLNRFYRPFPGDPGLGSYSPRRSPGYTETHRRRFGLLYVPVDERQRPVLQQQPGREAGVILGFVDERVLGEVARADVHGGFGRPLV